MLTATPRNWWSYDYMIHAGERLVAEVSRAAFAERGTLQIDGQSYSVVREDGLGPWVLRGPAGDELARAEKPSAWRDGFLLSVDGRELVFERPSPWRRHVVLRQGGAVIGEIRHASTWGRDAIISLPAELGLPVQLFLTLLMLFMWQREDATVVTAVSS